MTPRPDLTPTARRMADLLAAVDDGQLALPTPCPEFTLGDLIDHVGGLSAAFVRTARKQPKGPDGAPSADEARLEDGWRDRITRQLAELADAWREPGSWEGMTRAGGFDLPAEVAGAVALNELLVHGWDVARASGQPFTADPEALGSSLRLLEPKDGAGSEGLFGPIVQVPADAPDLDRVIGLSGRDPGWTPR
ncbi:TIGR03086 family metal-binding protein [Spirillospora sp. NBC_01491]|uniref:TIGR03086 family metal-binding protein n=1 Tax=Spirillospora sp. NBC_01491 TaxID=2976007 RepID=UPI002E306B0E|nr:TIGR03086 family metal-binding protein [Spirillospora sp. NBC_01491]